MSEIINIEQAVLSSLRILPDEKQQEVLNFIKFLVQKTEQKMQFSSQVSSTIKQKKQLSMQQIARLPVAERHQLLAPFMAATAEDFLNDLELTEFSVLDGEDWETENE